MNILLNTYCNLKCKYCFAKKIIKSEELPKQISMDNFEKYLDFCINSKSYTVELIGGEPLIIPNIEEYLYRIYKRGIFKKIIIFSNGTYNKNVNSILDKYNKLIPISLLINVNAKDDIGTELYENLKNNLDYMDENNIDYDLGINLYKKEQNYMDFINLASEHHKRAIRWALASPCDINNLISRKEMFYHHYHNMMDTVLDFLKAAYERNIKTEIDCSAIPLCTLDDLQLRKIATYSPVLLSHHICLPSLDVLPDLSVIRCFAMCNDMRVPLSDFKSDKDIFRYFIKNIDMSRNNIAMDECQNCDIYSKFRRCCGCLKLSR